jgi:hypothetical protein
MSLGFFLTRLVSCPHETYALISASIKAEKRFAAQPQGIAAEILFCEVRTKKIAANSPLPMFINVIPSIAPISSKKYYYLSVSLINK